MLGIDAKLKLPALKGFSWPGLGAGQGCDPTLHILSVQPHLHHARDTFMTKFGIVSHVPCAWQGGTAGTVPPFPQGSLLAQQLHPRAAFWGELGTFHPCSKPWHSPIPVCWGWSRQVPQNHLGVSPWAPRELRNWGMLKEKGAAGVAEFPGRIRRCWCCLPALPALVSTSQPSTAHSNCVPNLLLEIASLPHMHFYINKGTKWPLTSLCNVFFNGRSWIKNIYIWLQEFSKWYWKPIVE